MHVRYAGLVVLASAAGLAWAGAAEPPQPPQSRDALWRMIFARPVAGLEGTSANMDLVALGHALFRDKRLSGNGSRSCASCHEPANGFSNALPRGIGLDGQPLRRNVPGLFNLAWGKAFYWDGRAPSLEAQARFPIVAKNEMAGDFPTIVARLDSDPAMKQRFQAAFPERPVIAEATILEALAGYERTLVSPQTRFDRWVGGDDAALSTEEMQGFNIFVGRGGCVACHGGWRFTDDAFHDIGLRSDDPGRGAIPGGVPGLRQFKTASLRELASTAPYMHDGSLPTLRAVVDHYVDNLERRPSLAANIRRDLVLNEEEKQDLVAFLLTVSSREGGGLRP